ncbi:MAG: hypothetical protein H0V28_01565 [Rubrobacteraceae bacterium]|nr:hypothetical protein [Rubrobacteraceae bacterium]
MQPDRGRDLDGELRDLGPRVEYPPIPDLASSVRGRLESESGGPGSPARPLPRFWWIAAAALFLLVAVPVVSLAVRGTGGGGMAGGAAESGEHGAGDGSDAVGESRTVLAPEEQEGPVASSADASSSAGALAASAGTGTGGSAEGGASGESLGLGERIPLPQARVGAEASILLPRSPKLGEPDEVYAREGRPGFVFVYRARSGMQALEDTDVILILTQMPGGVGKAYLPGGTVRGAGLETVGVGGGKGYWIPPRGDSPEVARSGGLLAGVLLWERDGQALRLEADVPKGEAVRIAESVR